MCANISDVFVISDSQPQLLDVRFQQEPIINEYFEYIFKIPVYNYWSIKAYGYYSGISITILCVKWFNKSILTVGELYEHVFKSKCD